MDRKRGQSRQIILPTNLPTESKNFGDTSLFSQNESPTQSANLLSLGKRIHQVSLCSTEGVQKDHPRTWKIDDESSHQPFWKSLYSGHPPAPCSDSGLRKGQLMEFAKNLILFPRGRPDSLASRGGSQLPKANQLVAFNILIYSFI